MYRKLLYNDNCIYNEKTHTVIYSFDSDWDEYIKWKKLNSDSEIRIALERKAKLKWNQGAPQTSKTNKTAHGKLQSYYHTNGNLLKEEYTTSENQTYLIKTYFAEKSGDLLATQKEYTNLGNWQMKEGKLTLFPADIKSETRYYHEPYLLSYKRETLEKSKQIIENEYSIHGYLSSTKITKGNLVLKVQYNQSKLPTTKELYKNDKLVFLKKYFDNTKIKYYTKKYKDTYVQYNEYYINSSLRTEGMLTKNYHLPNDEWTYYHITNEVEGVHQFDKGKLIKSRINMEDGTFIKEVIYD